MTAHQSDGPRPGTEDLAAQLIGVRDRLGQVLGHNPDTWIIVETVLETITAHLRQAEPVHTTAIDQHSPEGDTARAAVARGLPAATDLATLLAHERSTGAMLAVRDVFDDVAPWRREAKESRRKLASVAQLLRTLRLRPIEDRPPVEREAVAWLIDRLDATLRPDLPLLEDALAVERHRVSHAAAELAAPTGMARLEWLARLNAALAEDAAPSATTTPPADASAG